ncbi:MAG: EmrB/QacA family drug resistance transporter, partial [Paucibacter sp.]|nr:EmrB/QacA family drug resistance transporter [Roseateles sp.]
VSMLAAITRIRLDALTAGFSANGIDAAGASRKAMGVVDLLTRKQAYMMAYNDAFLVMAAVLFGCIFILWLADGVKSPSGGGNAAH